MASPLLLETVWFDKYKYEDAERRWQEHIAKHLKSAKGDNLNISLNSFADTSELSNRVQKLEEENRHLREMHQDLIAVVHKLESRVLVLEDKQGNYHNPSASSKSEAQPKDDENDDDIDLFGSEEEDETTTKLRQQQLKDYETKKAAKKQVIAKSSIVLDVKPWDDETDMKQMELSVRNIKTDGLTWGASKLVPLAFGIFKLQIVCIVEDEKVSVDWLQETIQEIEDYVQSVDIAAFNKL
uniref:Elongation factor 1-delta n=1 Tax=Hadrurus spadix TaxID=141984 RepID=A0A1W7RAL2_9SCOR